MFSGNKQTRSDINVDKLHLIGVFVWFVISKGKIIVVANSVNVNGTYSMCEYRISFNEN